MSWVATAVIGGAVIGGVATYASSSNAADTAANAQRDSTQAGIAQQKYQFDQVQKLLAPYASAGPGALSQQQNLLGLNGSDAQAKAYSAMQTSPAFTALTQQGENAILQNASATGGLRGGNTQGALAQFRPALLASMINDQFSKLGGITSIGQNAAAGTGNAGMQTGNSISGLLGQMGQINAGNALAQGRATNGLISGVTGGIGQWAGYNGFGGAPSYTTPNMFGQYANPTQPTPYSGVDQFNYLGGATTAGDYSDVRLKKNLRRIGKTDRGHAVYTWDWKQGGRGAGVIAQEVAAVDPGAVSADRFGFLKVDYSRV